MSSSAKRVDALGAASDATASPTVAVVGLGEAGRVYGTALQGAGHAVRGYDPYADGRVEGIAVVDSLAAAVADAEVVLVLTSAAAGPGVAHEAAGLLRRGATYVDCTSSAPTAKRSLLDVFGSRPDVVLADVAILGPVVQLGAATPLMAAGPAAASVAALMEPFGADVAVVDGELGDAMAHKLLRSVFMKGLAAAVTEAVTAGRAAGFEDWIRGQIARELSGDGQQTIDRFLRGSVVHAGRRAAEMEAATAYLTDLGVDATMAAAAAEHLHGLRRDG